MTGLEKAYEIRVSLGEVIDPDCPINLYCDHNDF